MFLRFVLYLAITAYVFFAPYYLLTRKYSQEYSFADRLLGTFVLGVSQIILTEVALAFPLKLTSLNLLLLNVAVSTCLVLLAGFSRREVVRQLREARDTVVGFFKLALKHKIVLTILALAVFQVLWWAFQAYVFPPYAWDELSYHLPKVAYIMQSHGITEFPSSFYWVNQDPFTIELVFLWNVIYLKNDILVNGTQIIFAIAAVLAIYGIARKLGVKPQHAAFAMVFLFVPIVIQQATTCYIDIAVSSMFLVAVNFMLAKDRPRVNVIMLGLSVGIMVSAKYTFILPGLVLSLAFVFIMLRESGSAGHAQGRWLVLRRKGLLQALCLYAIPLLLVGAIWYVRDWIAYGNPLAPLNVSFLGKTIFHGSASPNDLRPFGPVLTSPPAIINSWLERTAPTAMWNYPFYTQDVGNGGFGPVFLILLLPSIAFSLVIAFRKRLSSYFLVAIVFTLSFLVMLMNWYSRYTLFFCAFGVLAFTLVMQHMPKQHMPNRKTIAIIALPIIVFTMTVGNAHNTFTPANTLDFIQRPLAERQSSDLPSSLSDFEDYRDMYQRAVETPATTILYTALPGAFSYPLWGSSFSNRVAQIPGQYADYEEFAERVNSYGESLIITTEDSAIARYCDDNMTGLELVYQKDTWRIVSYAGDKSVQEE